jgi:hypothetical protein
MATLVRPNVEVHLKQLGEVGIPDGFVVVKSGEQTVKVAYELVGDVPEELDAQFIRDIQTALNVELLARNFPQAQRVYVGA